MTHCACVGLPSHKFVFLLPGNCYHKSSSPSGIMAKNSDKTNKSDQKKPSSPPRKAVPDRDSNRHAKKYENANQVRYKMVGIDNMSVGMVYKADGKTPAFLGNILGHIESDRSKMDRCKLIFFTKMRNPDGTDEVYEVANKQGNKYPIDVAVFCTLEGEHMSAATSNFTRTLNEIANSECKNEWRFGVPLFVHKGNSTPPTPLPISTYLVNNDCISVIKKVYENVETKTSLMNNEFRDGILAEVFGNADAGFNVVDSMDEELYDNL